jgi:hypothetical protein
MSTLPTWLDAAKFVNQRTLQKSMGIVVRSVERAAETHYNDTLTKFDAVVSISRHD